MRMTTWVRLAVTMVFVLVHVITALLMVALVFPFRSHANRQRLVRWWSRRVMKVCHVRVLVTGPSSESDSAPIIEQALRPGGIGAMLVMNHVSWLDIFIIHAMRPAHFVAKAEIARWPILGYLTDRTGAVFIERGKRHAVREANHKVATMLAEGELVGMFPEGAVSDGNRLLPFHGNLIQPAIDTGAPVIVAGIRYRDADGGPTTAALYVGEINMLQSIVRIVRQGPIVAEVQLIEAIDGTGKTRHQLARAARALIADALDFDDEAHEAAEGISTVIVVPDDQRVSPEAALAGKALETLLDPRDELL
jgi:1-acyl-sn-glycerol-3-phosphate acyltransferase